MQQEPILSRKIKLTLVVFFGLIIIWAIFAAYKNLGFKVISTNPGVSNVTAVTPFFDIKFNKPLSSKVSVNSNSDLISSYKVSGDQLDIYFSIPLNPSETYTLNVSNIYDSSGNRIANLSYSIKPSPASGSLPSDQGQALLNNQSQYNQSVEDSSLLQQLPFTEPNLEYEISYTVNYSAQSPVPIIQITAPNQQDQQAGLAWISSQGYNPSNLDIQYVTGQPQ